MLKQEDYTATPQQSAKVAIRCHSLPAPPFSSPSAQRLSSKCMRFAKPLLLIDYRAVPQVTTVTDVPAAYLEPDL